MLVVDSIMQRKRFPSIVLGMLAALFLGFGPAVQAQDVVDDAVEQAALQALYDSTDGANWTEAKRWSEAALTAFPDSTLYGVTIEDGDVVSIGLSSAGLSGTLPPTLANLAQLQTLTLSSNSGLTGAMPDLSNLTALTTLNISGHSLSGDFPDWLGALTALETLNLAGSSTNASPMEGAIPAAIGKLSALTSLSLGYNDFSEEGAIPDSLSYLDNLNSLSLIGCDLTLSSVSSGLSGLNSLTGLVLSYNSSFRTSSGMFPDSVLYDLPSLQALYLDATSVTSLPASFQNLPLLSTISLSRNTVFSDVDVLETVFDTLSVCSNLTTLYLTNCNIVALPSNTGSLASVETLYLSDNTTLDPDQCEALGNMPALKSLYLYTCNLTDLPSTLTSISTLELLNAAENNLYPIPELIKNIPSLSTLILTDNGIGALPDWFGSERMATMLTKLVIDKNEITLPLPDNFMGMASLTYLDMSENAMAGTLASSFSQLTSISYLDLSDNQITSPLPDMSSWASLATVNVSENALSGTVPTFLGNLTVAKTLVSIAGNEYDEMTAFESSTSLTLAIGDNNFSFTEILKAETPFRSFTYAPQDSVDTLREVRAYVGGTLTLPAYVDTATSPASLFQWYQYVDGTNDIALASTATAAAKVFQIQVTEEDQDNEYYYKITNTAASNLTLVSRLLHLTVVCTEIPDTVAFSTTQYLCALKFDPIVEHASDCRTIAYAWDFGDGVTDEDKRPLHAYGDAGTYEVSLTIQYTCGDGICISDTTVTQSVTNLPAEATFTTTTITVPTETLPDVLAVSAATFSDAWPLAADTVGLPENEYLNGSLGVWRNEGVYAYDVPRAQSDDINLSTDGTFNLDQFNWTYAAFDAIPHWIKANSITQYNTLGYELENQDVLGIYSVALYDYGGHLPSASGVNMRYEEMAYTGFEFLEEGSSGNWMFGSETQPTQKTFDIYSATGNLVTVEASLADLEDVSQVDVTCNEVFLIGEVWFPVAGYIANDEIICSQEYPDNPEWTMLVLRKSPYSSIWRGNITVHYDEVPEVTPVIDTIAHSGASSLKIAAETTFPQTLLQLDSGKSYYISAWVSVNDPYVTTPSLGSDLGIEVVFRDDAGDAVSTTTIIPTGPIIEGWQQVKGSFVCPDASADLELTFKPGSGGTAWYDDLRLHPEQGNMRSYVYDLNDYRLQAILDEENFASFFYYDREGNLKLTKKETEDGIKTISENISYIAERSE